MPEELIRRKRRRLFSNYHIRFAGVILPERYIADADDLPTGENAPFNETLFTATSAVCVTGL